PSLVLMDSAQRKQLFFVVDHLGAAGAGQRVIFQKENRFLRANFLAEAAEDAAKHVDVKFFGGLFHIAGFGSSSRPWRNNVNGFGRTDELEELAGDAFGAALLILHQVRRTPVTLRHDPLLFGILHRHFFLKKMPNRDLESADNRRQVKPLPKIEFFAFNDHFAIAHNTSAVPTMFASANGIKRRQPKFINWS